MADGNDTAMTNWRTVPQAAKAAQCGPKMIYDEVRKGRLRAARIGGRRDLRIHQRWIDEWLEAAATPVEVPRRRGLLAEREDR